MQVAVAQLLGAARQLAEEGGVLDDRDLDRLGDAGAPGTVVERLEEAGVVDDRARRGEGAVENSSSRSG